MAGNASFLRPNKRKRNSPEADECVKFYDWYLKARGTFKIPCFIIHVANEYSGEYRPAFGAKLARMGKVSGALDYLIHTPKETFWIEFKHGKNGLSDAQCIFINNLDAIGIDHEVVYSFEAAVLVLHRKGICNMPVGL